MPDAGPVLVVDDDAAIRNAVRDLLESAGIAVETATDGADALEKVSRHRPRLVLLDMRMPVLDGWAFASALRERGVSLPVVVMTAAADASRWADEIGAIGVVAKPFGVAELVSAVRRFSAGPSAS
ncbi:MAG TPA: response regulator [Candidatus Limnocylindria bacterium]|nr:response regulator [Candidatus Limnocylindria bacterium]